jgi:hypothetical protein
MAPADAAPGALTLGHGDILIAAITCTNTSNPSVLLAAGLLAKKAVKAGLHVQPHIKTSLAPGSRIVTEYLEKAGLLPYLEQLGFAVAAYGCTTCIGNAGDLTPELNETIVQNDLVCAAVLSGNRNFEARIHPNLKANLPGQPAAGRRLRDCRHGHPRSDDRTGRPGQGQRRQVARHLPGRHLAQQRRDLQVAQVRHGWQGLPQELREGHDQARQAVETDQGGDRSGLHLAAKHLHCAPALL